MISVREQTSLHISSDEYTLYVRSPPCKYPEPGLQGSVWMNQGRVLLTVQRVSI